MMTDSMTYLSKVSRPIVRWHGGKWRLAPWIISHIPAHRHYVEPFGGGGSVLLKKNRSFTETYNDLDEEITNLFRVARDQGDELSRLLRLTPYARKEFDMSYIPTDDKLESARRLVVRVFMGFGSNAHGRTTGFRSKSHRSHTSPQQDWSNYPNALSFITERLQGVVIENRDAIEVIRSNDSAETAYYIDPPYLPETRDAGNDYSHEMSEQDHIDLAKTLHQCRGSVVISGYDSELYKDLYRGWFRHDRKALADGARERTETIWTSHQSTQLDFLQGDI